jgi:threonylcarbamoyladenosine tRNA methylthiotransferase MtaB
MPNIYLTYLGCRLNESEIEELAWRFAAHGHNIVDDPVTADFCVVNTCTVTGEAGRKSRQLVRRMARLNPAAQIAVTGCHATVAPEEVRELLNVAWVVQNADKERLADFVEGKAALAQQRAQRRLGPGTMGRTRAFVKVQDGCDNRCTFCITTIARGDGRSRPMEQIVAEVQGLVAAGYLEAVLTGVHLGSYGRDLAETASLRRLVETLLLETELVRLRLSSLEPWDLDPGFFELWTDSRMCRQLHLPLQSGCDATLRRMARRTTSSEFAQLVDRANAHIPDLALTTDVLVGFPGETDADFQESYRFLQQMAFARLHVFPFSPRPGTAAARIPEQVPDDIKTARSRAVRHLGKGQERAFHRRFVGCSMPVLWEMSRNGHMWRGHTDNYLTVTTASPTPLANTITPTRFVEAVGQGLRGEIVSHP